MLVSLLLDSCLTLGGVLYLKFQVFCFYELEVLVEWSRNRGGRGHELLEINAIINVNFVRQLINTLIGPLAST